MYSTEQLARFKWPITASREIKASSENIWTVISNPGNLVDSHPFCEKSIVDVWPGVGAKDTIHYYSGWVMHREFSTWIDGVGYDLTIGREGGRKSYVSWRITPEQENNSILSITLYLDTLQNIPVAIRWLPYLASLRPNMQTYLESVVKGFEWFITTGKPVTKNQFGSHPWFSPENNSR